MGQLVSSTIAGLFNGISQQSVTMRLDSQGEIQENAMGTIVDGLYKRPHSEHIAIFNASNIENAFMHEINRDLVERYVVFITGHATEPIEVYKLDGTKCTVRYGHLDKDLVFTEDVTVMDYLDTSLALQKAYKLISIADYTLIANREKVAAVGEELSPGTIDGRVQSFLELPDPYETTTDYSASTAYQKGDLAKYTDGKVYYYKFESIIFDWNNTAAYKKNDVVLGPNRHVYIYIWTGDSATNIATTNTTYWTDLGVYPLTGKLPTDTQYWKVEGTYAVEGHVYEVTGDEGNQFDNYFVKFSDGAWAECLGPGEPYKLNPTTLPHRLVRTGVDQFTFGPCLWEDRVVGDDDSCPVPSFIGKKITNLTFFKNRLGFLASDTFFLSRAGRYFELFGETAIDLLDDDPIDTLASSTMVVNLYSSIPFDKNLMLNSAQGQFSFGSSGTNLTPTTASITGTTMYATSPDSDPVGAGANVYFVNPRHGFVSIMEYLIQPDTLVEDASDITAHCPHYIPNGTIKLMSCVPMDMLLAFSDADKRTIFVYKYYWIGNEKPQSAWSKWTFDGDILGVGLIDTSLLFTIKRGNEIAFEKIQLENIPVNQDFDYRVHLDRQVRVQGVYDAVTATTTWTLPYDAENAGEIAAINPVTGFPVNINAVSGSTIKAAGDRTASMYTIGVPFRMRYRFSEWYVKDAKKVSIIDAKLQIRTLTLSYKNTGAFNLEITPEGRETIVKRFSGVKVGVSKIGKASMLTGEEKFLILAKSKYTTIDIVSDSYLPCQITSASFEGMYVTRSTKA